MLLWFYCARFGGARAREVVEATFFSLARGVGGLKRVPQSFDGFRRLTQHRVGFFSGAFGRTLFCG